MIKNFTLRDMGHVCLLWGHTIAPLWGALTKPRPLGVAVYFASTREGTYGLGDEEGLFRVIWPAFQGISVREALWPDLNTKKSSAPRI